MERNRKKEACWTSTSVSLQKECMCSCICCVFKGLSAPLDSDCNNWKLYLRILCKDETFQYSSLWKGRKMEKSPKRKLLLMFLYRQLDPVHVKPKDGKAENENISIKVNKTYHSVTARKDFCSKAEFFSFISNLKLKNGHLSRLSI